MQIIDTVRAASDGIPPESDCRVATISLSALVVWMIALIVFDTEADAGERCKANFRRHRANEMTEKLCVLL